ncbi:acyltransferase family protein [Haliscomenobacter hydrossis]|uniref:Acyltransferase 3 n=1 Tax=Haliscomenobacter hydrossis (strain ATCC 27775 / DSM 1100 / LMG 10767 / O) TaxID=760192 RepID=F4L430_HALH1|nr:acyltransferase [Haliscomenobacter hydrossis]AEE50728.1 acyltransferase 3 [Haliscomenobacter hydrossis DSM 1100]
MNIPTTVHPNTRNATIDGWRGLSIILVLLGHTGRAISQNNILARFSLADEGVHIFFIISGYLITHLLLTRIHSAAKEAQPIKKFYLRRFLRILPAFYAFHLILLLLRKVELLDFSNELFLKNILFLANFNFLGGTWILGHIWSLSVEEQFYLVWPWAVYYLPIARIKWLCLVVIGLSPLIRALNYLYPTYSDFWAGGFFQHADSIAFGAMLSLLIYTKQERILNRLRNPMLLLGLAGLSAVIWALKYIPHTSIITIPLYYTVFSLFFSVLIWVSMAEKTTAVFIFQALKNPVLGFIGKISFSLYLWQQLFLWPMEYQSASSGLLFQQIPYNIAFVGLAGVLSYFLIEKTFLRLKGSWQL